MDKKCRTCSRNDQFEGISVNAISKNHQEPIYLMLIYCTQLQYSTNDTLPQQICPECLVLLDGAFSFWKQCRQTDATFRYGVLDQLLASSVEDVPPFSAAREDPPVPAAAVAESSPTPQKIRCCFRKCTKETTSEADMERHAKLDHFTARVANEVLRIPDHKVVCSVCCTGFKSLGSYEFHRLNLPGTRPKPGSGVSNKQQQQQQPDVDEPMDDLEAVEATVVKEELVLDDWPEDKEGPHMEFVAEESKIDEGQDETLDETRLEEQMNVLYDILMMKLAEAFAKTQDHFQIPLTNKEYIALKERGLLWRRFRKAAISRYKKWMRLIIICDGCQFQTNVYPTMQKHTKKRSCRGSSLSYALATYESSVQFLVCVPCGYETNDSYSIRRHQRLLGHEGIDISRSETTGTKLDAPKETSTSSSPTLDIVSVKEEPYISDDDQSSLDVPPENAQYKFDCIHCGTEIFSEAEKQRHLVCECPVLHSKDGRYTCEHCKTASFPTVADLRSHVRSECTALQGKPIISRKIIPKECDRCNKTFATSELLSRHAVFCTTTTKKDKESFTCATCGAVFTNKYNFEKHIKLRACLKDPNQCKNCFTTFSEVSALKRHRKFDCPALLNVESSGLRVTCKCDRCGKGFVTKRMLRLHKLTDGCGERRVAKPAEGKLQCPYCFVQFCRPDNLKRHLEANCVVLQKNQAEAERVAAQKASGTNVPMAAHTGET